MISKSLTEYSLMADFTFHFRAYDGSTVLGVQDLHEDRHPTPDVPYASPLIIPQWRVEETLRLCLEGRQQQVELATELIALEEDDESVTATLKRNGNQETARCKYLVAADGGRSIVRRALNVEFEGETWKGERMLVGDVRVPLRLRRDHPVRVPRV